MWKQWDFVGFVIICEKTGTNNNLEFYRFSVTRYKLNKKGTWVAAAQTLKLVSCNKPLITEWSTSVYENEQCHRFQIDN